MSGIEDRALNVLSKYRAAVLSKDVEGMMALYADDVRVFDAWTVWTYEGVAAWRLAVERWFGSVWDETVKVSLRDIRTDALSGLAVVTGTATYTAASAKGEEERSIQNRVTWVLARRDSAWKIVHEHSSAPIELEGMKPILRRPSKR